MTKERFNEIRKKVNDNKKLFTWVDGRKSKVTGKEVKNLINHIINKANTKNIDKETKEMYNNIVNIAGKMYEANIKKPTNNRTKLIDIFKLAEEIIFGNNISELETEEEAEKRARSSESDKENQRKSRVKQAEESVKKIETILKNGKQSAKGLKIMTPNQLLARLPILLAQKQAGNNSQKLNNEIRQIIYSLYQLKIYQKQSIII